MFRIFLASKNEVIGMCRMLLSLLWIENKNKNNKAFKFMQDICVNITD